MIGRIYSETEKAALKDAVIAARGYWHPFHDGLLKMSPSFLEAYLRYQNAPFMSAHLEPKVREFIYIAIDASVTHLYQRGLQRHVERALTEGASADEVLEVILLTCSAAAYHTAELGFPILDEIAGPNPVSASVPTDDPRDTLSAEAQRQKQEFAALTGGWPAGGDTMLREAPEFAAGLLGYRSVPWRDGPLPPKIKHLIGLALAAAPTTLNERATRAHIKGALDHGASCDEISDVLQLAGAISIHTCTFAIPALVAALTPDPAQNGE